jgi:hypothetical protein
MTLEYLTSNELKKYPFVDSLSLKDTEGNQLVNSIFADICILINNPEIASVSLLSSEDNGTNIILTFSALDKDDVLVANTSINIIKNDVSLHSDFSEEDNNLTIKIVTGSSFLTIGNRDFLVENTKLVNSAVHPYTPRVTTLTFMNGDTVVKQFSKEKIIGTDISIKEGTNIAFSSLNNLVYIDVNPGLGAGLFNNCDDGLVIKSINSIKPDAYQNFLLNVDECYETEKGYQGELDWIPDFGITISNTCTPRCTSEQFGAFAHYLNRVKDGMETVSELAASINEEIADMIDAYNNDTSRIVPFVKAAVTKFENPYGRAYYSFIISFFNKTTDEINVTTDITFPVGVSLEPKSARFKQGSRTTAKLSANITDTVPCHQQGRFEFTVKATPGQIIEIEATAGVTNFSQTFTLT